MAKETQETSSLLCPLRQLISLSSRKCFSPVCWRCTPLTVPWGTQKYLRETELKRSLLCFDESTRRKIKPNALEQWRQDRLGRKTKDKASTPAEPMTACWWAHFFLIICRGIKGRQHRGTLNNSEWLNFCCVDLFDRMLWYWYLIASHFKEIVHVV